MADDRVDTRDWSWRQLFPWTELFRGFRVAIGLSKLALAAAGILTMAVLWYLLGAFFYWLTPRPDLSNYPDTRYANIAEGPEREAARWRDFHGDRETWNLMLEAAGPIATDEKIDAADLATSREDYDRIQSAARDIKEPDDSRVHAALDHLARKHKVTPEEVKQLAEILAAPAAGRDDKAIAASTEVRAKALIAARGITKPSGRLRTLPWFEDRGPNPFLLITGQAGIPWETGHFWDWLLTREGPVLVEPLVKFLRPVVYFFSPRLTGWPGWLGRLYFLLVIIVTLGVWAFFGAMITRMAAVEVARNEKISAIDAFRFVTRRYLSYALAPIFPLLLAAVLVIVLFLYGVLHMIPGLGDIVIDGLFWWVAIGIGLGMACCLVGLVSWPLMVTTISTEDEEGFNAFARAYSYLIQAPWHYLWYSIVALAYGAVVVFFVGLMGSLAVYLASWGVSKGTLVPSRNPSYLFVYAPTSFGWRALLLQGASVQDTGEAVVQEGEVVPRAYEAYLGTLHWWNVLGAALVTVWLYLFFLLVLGFGYSYFWTASSIIYLLMRRRVDDAEMDEVYFEEDEQDDYPLGPPAATKPASAPLPGGTTMVDAPSLRVPTPPASAPPPPPPVTPPPPPPAPPVTDRVDEPVRPTTTTSTVTPPAPPAEDLRPGGNGSPPPPEG